VQATFSTNANKFDTHHVDDVLQPNAEVLDLLHFSGGRGVPPAGQLFVVYNLEKMVE
jgi:hypothetical protein